MKFLNLTIENFLAITEAKVNLADRGLVGIQGVNHLDTSANSNGSGKSSIADALCWCWFGVTARGASGDEVINHEAKKDCRVISELQDGHLIYTATRHRKHKTGKNSFTLTVSDGFKTTDLTKGTDKLTQELALQILGASYEVFKGSIYAGQEQMPDLPSMTDKHLKLLIEEAAGTTVLEGAYQKAREALNAAQKNAAAIKAQLESLNAKRVWIDNQIIDTIAQRDSWTLTQQNKIAAAKAEAATYVPVIKDLQAQIADFDALKLDDRIAALDARIAAVSAETDRLAELDKEVTRLQMRQQAIRDRQAEYRKSAEEQKHKLAHLNGRVGEKCHACGHEISEADLGSVRERLEEQIQSFDSLLAKAISDEAEAARACAEAIKARDDFKASMTDTKAVTSERAALQAKLVERNDMHRRFTAAVAQAKAAKDRIALLAAEQNPYAASLVSLEKQKEANAKEIEATEKRLKAACDQVELEEAVVKVFSPAGVRARILDDVTPFLNAQTSKYLATLSDGNISAVWTTLTRNAKGELKEKFSIDVTNDTGGQIFKSLSGGEKRKVRVATALALQDLVATRASKPIDLFIGDEIDDALDQSGLERLMIILEEKARERGSVFVISHNELRDYISNVLLVEKMPDKTTKVSEVVL